MGARPSARFLLLLTLIAACDTGPRQAVLDIGGDTLIYAAKVGLPNGAENAVCGYYLTARYHGKKNDTALIRQGRVTYSLVETKLEHGTWEWTPERLASVWPHPGIAGGQTDTSRHHDIAFSLPFHPIRGEVTFDFVVKGDDSVRTTRPFIFTCR